MYRALAVLVTVSAAAASALAQPATADRLAAEAQARADAKDFLGAAAKFREAYAADPRPDLICNVGVAYHKAQELPRAQLYLSRCLERGTALEARYMEAVRGVLSAIDAALRAGSYTPVDIVVEPRFATVAISAFASDETLDGSRTIWLREGSHRITVRAEGHAERTVPVEARGRTVIAVTVKLDRTGPGDPGAGSGSGSAGMPDQSGRPAAEARPSKLPAIGATVATLALGAVAVYAGMRARDHAERAEFALRDSAYQADVDAIGTWNTVTGVSMGLAGAGAVAAGYLWYRALRRPARVELSARGVGFAIGGTF